MAGNPEHLGAWQSWHPREVAKFFSALAVPWWIAGGWALDLFLGFQTREHEDIDVEFLRRDQQAVRALLGAWDIQEAHPELAANWPFREWELGQDLSPDVHDIWCRPNKDSPWTLQLLVNNVIDDQWVFRRDARISRPLASIGRLTDDGIPYIVPEIQNLFKAKGLRPKDEVDFARTLPYLDEESRSWLAQALAIAHPGHPWLAQLWPRN
jgi:hypothetical protein